MSGRFAKMGNRDWYYKVLARSAMPAYGFLDGVAVSTFVDLATEIAIVDQPLSPLKQRFVFAAILFWGCAGFFWTRFVWSLEEVLKMEDEKMLVQLIIPRSKAGSPITPSEKERVHIDTLNESTKDGRPRWEHLIRGLRTAVCFSVLGLLASLLLAL